MVMNAPITIFPGERCRLLFNVHENTGPDVLYRGKVKTGPYEQFPHEFIERGSLTLGNYIVFFKLRENGFKILQERSEKIVVPIRDASGRLFFSGFYDTMEIDSPDHIQINDHELKQLLSEIEGVNL